MKKLSYFSASWCFPCKTVKPLITKLEDKFDVSFYDVEEHADLAREKGVKSVPTVIIEGEDGKCERLIGASQITISKIEELV